MRSTIQKATVVAAALLLLSCGSSRDSTSASSSDDNAMLAKFQVLSKDKMKEALKDPDSAKYDDVMAYKVTLDGVKSGYAFCGKVNSKNSFGGYSGSERFVASPGVAVVESQMSDFSKVWDKLCDPANKADPIWW